MKTYAWAYDHACDVLQFAVEHQICEPDLQLWGVLHLLGEIRDGKRAIHPRPHLVPFDELYGRSPSVKKSASNLDRIERAAMHEIYLDFGNLLWSFPNFQGLNIMTYLEQFARARAAMPKGFKGLSQSKQSRLLNDFYLSETMERVRKQEALLASKFLDDPEVEL